MNNLKIRKTMLIVVSLTAITFITACTNKSTQPKELCGTDQEYLEKQKEIREKEELQMEKEAKLQEEKEQEEKNQLQLENQKKAEENKKQELIERKENIIKMLEEQEEKNKQLIKEGNKPIYLEHSFYLFGNKCTTQNNLEITYEKSEYNKKDNVYTLHLKFKNNSNDIINTGKDKLWIVWGADDAPEESDINKEGYEILENNLCNKDLKPDQELTDTIKIKITNNEVLVQDLILEFRYSDDIESDNIMELKNATWIDSMQFKFYDALEMEYL